MGIITQYMWAQHGGQRVADASGGHQVLWKQKGIIPAPKDKARMRHRYQQGFLKLFFSFSVQHLLSNKILHWNSIHEMNKNDAILAGNGDGQARIQAYRLTAFGPFLVSHTVPSYNKVLLLLNFYLHNKDKSSYIKRYSNKFVFQVIISGLLNKMWTSKHQAREIFGSSQLESWLFHNGSINHHSRI